MQQVQLLGGLGMIPSLQFSADPGINPNINPYLKMPKGMTQLTVQPTGEYRTSGEAQLQGNRLQLLSGLGRVRDHRRRRQVTTYAMRTGGNPCHPCWPVPGGCDCGGMATRTMAGLGVPMNAMAHKPAGIYTRHRLVDIGVGPGPGFNGLGGIFDSAWWTERKWLAFGLVGLLGLGAAAVATKVLR